MAKAKALTVKRIEKLLKVPGKYTDGEVQGLILTVEGPGSAAWMLRYQSDHEKHWMGLGSAIKGRSKYLSLADAREKAREVPSAARRWRRSPGAQTQRPSGADRGAGEGGHLQAGGRALP